MLPSQMPNSSSITDRSPPPTSRSPSRSPNGAAVHTTASMAKLSTAAFTWLSPAPRSSARTLMRMREEGVMSVSSRYERFVQLWLW